MFTFDNEYNRNLSSKYLNKQIIHDYEYIFFIKKLLFSKY